MQLSKIFVVLKLSMKKLIQKLVSKILFLCQFESEQKQCVHFFWDGTFIVCEFADILGLTINLSVCSRYQWLPKGCN